MTANSLGSYEIKDESIGESFISFESQVWDCPSCNSALMAWYADRVGTNTSENDVVECFVCGDQSHYIYSATFPNVNVLVEGKERLP